MSRNIPILMQQHLAETVHTVAYAMKVTPVGENAPAEFGVVGLDYSISYNDLSASGELLYSNRGGFVPSAIKASGDLGVDNAESEVLIAGFDVGPFLIDQIRAGRYQHAKFVLYLINYKDLTPGNHVIELHGTIGRIRIANGLVCFPELRGASQAFRQSVCEVDSITCRRRFGDDICGVDLTTLWQISSVSLVGIESDRTFRLTGITPPTQGFAPGMANFLSGDNSGREVEIEDWSDLGGGVVEITLAHAADFPIELYTSVRIRPDCRKRFREDCITIYNNGLMFDGEPDIPVGDEGTVSMPGASVAPGFGLGGNPVPQNEEA